MTGRTVMTARISPASMRGGPRDVYVSIPESARPETQERVDAVLDKLIRDGDRLLYDADDADDRDPLEGSLNPVVVFGACRGLFADPIDTADVLPQLVIVILDPLGDNDGSLHALARAMNRYPKSDLVIAEMPDGPTRSPAITQDLPAD